MFLIPPGWGAQAKPLEVTTKLTTGTVKGQRLGDTGKLMDADGFVR